MRLAEMLQRDILKAYSGGLLSRLKLPQRRTVLFFEDILSDYISVCEKNGYSGDIAKIAKCWGALGTQQLVPAFIRRLPYSISSKLIKNLWTSFGLMDNFSARQDGNRIYITTKNEFVTRSIGRNAFMAEFFSGCTNSFFGSSADIIESHQTKGESRYAFELSNKKLEVVAKDKNHYTRLNTLSDEEGFTLKDALQQDILQLRANRVFFRGLPILPIENTLFHLFGDADILFGKIPAISYNRFREAIDGDTPIEKRFALLKTLLQAMGWGNMQVVMRGRNVQIEIKNLPHGLQASPDNWKFMSMVILGYLRLTEHVSISDIRHSPGMLAINYNR